MTTALTRVRWGIYNNTLYVSRDQNPPGSGSQNFTNVGKYVVSGGGLPTSSAGWTYNHVVPPASSLSSGGNNGSINLTAGTANGINNARIGSFVYLSPEQYFFANADTLYVADSGQPKNGNVNKAALGEGGLQKWSYNGSTWILDYDLVKGLSLVNNANANASTPTAPGVTGLFGLTGEVIGNQCRVFATSYGLNELSSSFLYEITDTLSDSTIAQASGESFMTLYSAPSDISIRGVAFAPEGSSSLTPTPLPASWTFMIIGLATFGWAKARRNSNGSRFAI